MRKAFDGFDREHSGSIPTDMVAEILRLMGQPFNKRILEDLIDEVDADSKYQKSPHYSFNLRPNNFFFKKNRATDENYSLFPYLQF